MNITTTKPANKEIYEAVTLIVPEYKTTTLAELIAHLTKLQDEHGPDIKVGVRNTGNQDAYYPVGSTTVYTASLESTVQEMSVSIGEKFIIIE